MNFNSLKIAISTYSILPVQQIDWTEENLSSTVNYIPIIGVFSGLLLCGWHRLCLIYIPYSILFSALATLIPVLISGGIHVDGYMDTWDALGSYQSRARKLEIMKDSHSGAFAMISLIALLILELGLWQVLASSASRTILVVALGQILARSLSVMAAGILPRAKKEGMMHDLTSQISNRRLMVTMLIISLIVSSLMVIASLIHGLAAISLAALTLLYYCRVARKQFGGVTGDTSGFAVEIIYLSVIIAVAVSEIVLRQI